jgi:hypothetical protein
VLCAVFVSNGVGGRFFASVILTRFSARVESGVLLNDRLGLFTVKQNSSPQLFGRLAVANGTKVENLLYERLASNTSGWSAKENLPRHM